MALPGKAVLLDRETPARLEVGLLLLECAIPSRCHPCVTAEVAGEGALITPTGLEGDITQGESAFVEEADGFIEPNLVQQLQGAHLEKSLNALFELIDRQSCVGGEIFNA